MARALPDLPPFAAWRHRDARDGFEVVFLGVDDAGGHRIEGRTAAVEAGEAWGVEYSIALAPDWRTRAVRVVGRSKSGWSERTIEADGIGGWRVDGVPHAHLDGCLDVDLESSAFTNALPVHRLALEVGHGAEAPAAYVRAPDLGVERLDQRYTRRPDDSGRQRYDYSAPRFEFAARLVYDEFGLVLEYPGIAVRAA